MTSVVAALLRWWRSRPAAHRPAPASARAEPAPADPEAALAPSGHEPARPGFGQTTAPFVPVAQPALRARTLARLGGLRQIPALQSLAQGFLRAAARNDASVDDVVASVEKDPALCVRVLRMANSAEVSPERRIDDVFTAVQMLGLRRVNTLSQALFVLRDSHRAGGVDWRHLWVHGLATAVIAQEIDRHLAKNAGEQLHLAALLHDVGKIVLSTVEPDAYPAILDKAWAGEGRFDALEAASFGVSHAEAGTLFARQCGLPAEVVAATEHHARPAEAREHRLTVAVVSLANYLAKAYGLGFSGARVGEADGELEDQPGWTVVTEETGVMPGVATISAAVQVAATAFRQELAGWNDRRRPVRDQGARLATVASGP